MPSSYVKTVSASVLPEQKVNFPFNYSLIVSFLPTKSMTIGTLLDRYVDKSKTASFGVSADVVVVVAIVVVDTGVVVISSHS